MGRISNAEKGMAPMIPEEYFASQLKAVRKEKGINQAELANAIGVHPGMISHWENGKQVPENGTIQKIADYLNVSVSYLLGGIGNSSLINIEYTEPEMDEFVKKFRVLSKSSLQIIGPAINATYQRDEEEGVLKIEK